MGLGGYERIGEDDRVAGEDDRTGVLPARREDDRGEGDRGGVSLALLKKPCLAEGLSDLAVGVYDGTPSDTLCIGEGNTLWPTLRGVMSLAGCVKCLALLSRSDRSGVPDLAGTPSGDILNSLALLAKS